MEFDFRIEPFTFEIDEAEMPTDFEDEGLADEVRRREPTRRPTPQARRPRPKPRPQRPRQPPRRPGPVAIYAPPYSPPINLINNSATGSEHARWVQSALNDVLGLQLPVDGVMTRETRSAIRSFQKQHDLPQDGKVGPDTERALIEARRPRKAPPAAPPDDAPDEATEEMEWLPEFDFGIQSEDYSSGSQPTVRRGSRGDAVVQLQLRLKSLGFDPGPADGIFGSNTDAAVRAFQSSRRITVDGIAGPQTWGQLYTSGSTPPVTTQPSKPSYGRGAVHLNVPFIGYDSNDAAGCLKRCSEMAKAVGVTVGGSNVVIQVAVVRQEDALGRVTLDPAKAREGIAYINSELDAGRPVVVGVSYKAGYTKNVDFITDHFVIITSRGTDLQHGIYYGFHDPATGDPSKGTDQRPANRFFINPAGGLFRPAQLPSPHWAVDKYYDVAMVRRNV